MSYEYLIDSSIWADYFSGSKAGERLHLLIDKGRLATSILAIAELADKYEREGRSFTNHLTFITSKAAIVPMTIAITLSAAKIKKEARKAKSKFGLIDALHVATAREQHATLLTTDNDLRGMDNVEFID